MTPHLSDVADRQRKKYAWRAPCQVYGALRFASKLFGQGRSALWARVSNRITTRVACALFAQLHALSLSWHVKRNTGATLKTMERGVKSVASFMQVITFTFAPTLLQLGLVMVIFSSFKIPAVSLILVAAAVLYVGFTLCVTKRRVQIRKAMNEIDNRASGRACRMPAAPSDASLHPTLPSVTLALLTAHSDQMGPSNGPSKISPHSIYHHIQKKSIWDPACSPVCLFLSPAASRRTGCRQLAQLRNSQVFRR